MVNCVVSGCTNRSSVKSKKQRVTEQTMGRSITFHVFPKDLDRRAVWIKAVRRKNWEPKPASVLCSIHFKDECYEVCTNNRVLRNNAVPTIFSAQPSSLQNVPSNIINSEEEASSNIKENAVFVKMEPVEASDDLCEDPLVKEPITNVECIYDKIPSNSTNSEEETSSNIKENAVFIKMEPVEESDDSCEDPLTKETITNVVRMHDKNETVCTNEEKLPSTNKTEDVLRREIKILQNKLLRKDAKIKRLEALVKVLKRKDSLKR